MSGKRTGAKKTSISSLKSRKKAVPVEEVQEEPEVVEEVSETSESEVEEKPLKKIPPKKRVTSKKVEEVAETETSESESEVPEKLPPKKKTPPKSAAKKSPPAKKAPPKVEEGQEAPSKPEKEKMVLTVGNSQLKIFEDLQKFYDLWKDVVDSKIKPNTIKEVKSRSKKFHKENYQAVETVLKEACDIAYKLKISSPKFKLFVLHKHVWDFVKAFGKVYDEAEFKETALFKYGIANSTIISVFTKLYVMVNREDLNIINNELKEQFNFTEVGNNKLPEEVKAHLKETFGITGLPHSYSKMNDDMEKFLSPLIDILNEDPSNKNNRQIRKDVISRPQFNKILEMTKPEGEAEPKSSPEFRSLEGDDLHFHEELIERVKKDEEWLNQAVKTYKVK